MKGVKGTSPHGYLRYRTGCRCLTCRRDEVNRVRSYQEHACASCGAACWGRRCRDCYVLETKKHYPVQPQGLRYQWGCP